MTKLQTPMFCALATTAQLEDMTSEINTVGKYDLRFCINSDTRRLLLASGDAATDDWVSSSTGTTVHTPV